MSADKSSQHRKNSPNAARNRNNLYKFEYNVGNDQRRAPGDWPWNNIDAYILAKITAASSFYVAWAFYTILIAVYINALKYGPSQTGRT